MDLESRLVAVATGRTARGDGRGVVEEEVVYTMFAMAQFLGFVELVRREGPRERSFLQQGNPQVGKEAGGGSGGRASREANEKGWGWGEGEEERGSSCGSPAVEAAGVLAEGAGVPHANGRCLVRLRRERSSKKLLGVLLCDASFSPQLNATSPFPPARCLRARTRWPTCWRASASSCARTPRRCRCAGNFGDAFLTRGLLFICCCISGG